MIWCCMIFNDLLLIFKCKLVLGRVQKSSGSGLLIYLEFGFRFVRVYYKLKYLGSGSRLRVYRVSRVSVCKFYCIFMWQFFQNIQLQLIFFMKFFQFTANAFHFQMPFFYFLSNWVLRVPAGLKFGFGFDLVWSGLHIWAKFGFGFIGFHFWNSGFRVYRVPTQH